MNGEVKIRYGTQDLIRLVKDDIIYKFGQRELAAYDLSTPGVFNPTAKVTAYPNPVVKVESVEEQMAPYETQGLPKVPRAEGSVNVRGDSLLMAANYRAGEFTLAGQAKYSKPEGGMPAHWVEIVLQAPLGITLKDTDRLPAVVDGRPVILQPSSDADALNGIVLMLDAARTTHEVSIAWDPVYAPEQLVFQITAQLEVPSITKIPRKPDGPKVTFDFPSEGFATAELEIEVNLEAGK